ncbi:MAG: hypothetical protein V7L29_12325 [Nostoc sp.]|uniref:oxidoreductase n=1 Tax=Nostoc sp. TaxID=1180 RepID=UPI002FF627E7
MIEALNPFNLAYIDLMEPDKPDLEAGKVINPVLSTFGSFYQGTVITNGGYDKSKGNDKVATGEADLVSFGKLFIANPDLPKRFTVNAELNPSDFKTFYGQGEKDLDKGYTDYPSLELQPSSDFSR